MFGRKNREEGAAADAAGPVDGGGTAVRERDPAYADSRERVVEERDPRFARRGDPDMRERDPALVERDPGPVERDPALVERERVHPREEGLIAQRARFGGLNWGAAFFGWLVAVGIAVILLAILSAAGTALGLGDVTSNQVTTHATTIGVGGAIGLIVVLMVAYYAGGYVAGRMSRFDGGRQGFGVWFTGLVITVLFAVAGVVFGSKYNVLAALNLPRIPVKEGDIVTGAIIALVVVLLGTLLAAVAGGILGRRYHLRVDRAALR